MSSRLLDRLREYKNDDKPMNRDRKDRIKEKMRDEWKIHRDDRHRISKILDDMDSDDTITSRDISKIKNILEDDEGYGDSRDRRDRRDSRDSRDRRSRRNNNVYKESIKNKLIGHKGRELRTGDVDEIYKMLNKVGIDRDDARKIENIIAKVKSSDNHLKSNNINRITNLLFDREGLSAISRNDDDDDDDKEEDIDYTDAPLCINHSVSDCPSDTCVVQKKKCVPNILNNENLCYNKKFHECVKPCRFFGKSVHDKGACHYFYSNLDEAKTEHKHIMKHITQFEKYIDILKSKSKSLISYLNSQLKKINKEINKLETKKTKLDTKFRSSSLTNYEEIMEEVRTASDELMKLNRRKQETTIILSQIKYLTTLNVSKNTKTKRRNNNRYSSRITTRRYRTTRYIN